MNVERLRMVKNQILQYPEESDMQSLHSDGCHCIFGWAQVLFSPRFLDRFWRGVFVKPPQSEQELFAYLGMSYAEGRRLYHRPLWPEDLNLRYLETSNRWMRAQITAEAIERFIADPGFRSDANTAWMNSRKFIASTLV